MKFLIHIPQLIYGGAEKVLVDFANYLVDKGHDVEIIETYERGFLKSEFNSKVTFESMCSNEYTEKFYVSLDDILKEKNILSKLQKIVKKIFITVVGYEQLAMLLAKKRYKNKKFDVAINYLETQSPQFIMKYVNANKYLQWIHIDVSRVSNIEFIDKQYKWYKKIDEIICVSKVAKESFNKRYQDLKDKTHIIYNFYNVDKIKSMAEGNKVFDDNEFNILSVGRLVEQKGYERAIDVFYGLKKQGYNFKWSIIGDGILREHLESKIKYLELDNEIKLLGIKENPYPYIKQCDLFFLPSLYEGFPTVTIEAKILEKFILSTDVSGIREQLTSNLDSIIVENNKECIYAGLESILSNKSITRSIGCNSRIQNIINNDKQYNRIIGLIKNSEEKNK